MPPPVRAGLSGATVKKGYEDASRQIVGLAGAHRRRTEPGTHAFDWYRPADWDRYEPPPGYLDEFVNSYKHALGQQSFEMLGSSIEAVGYMMDAPSLVRHGNDMNQWAKNLGIGEPPSVQSLGDIDSFDSGIRFLMGGLGSGLGSTTPSIAGGLAGAGAGLALGPGGALVGGLAGASVPAIPMNLGEAYDQFVQEGLDRRTAAVAAGWLTPALTALDTAGLFGAVSAATKPAKGAFMKRVAQRIAGGMRVGAISEGATEGMQSTLREAVAAELTDNPDLGTRALRILDETVIGSLTGGFIGGAGGVASAALNRGETGVDPEVDDLGGVDSAFDAEVAAAAEGVLNEGRARPRGPSARALPQAPLEGEVLPGEGGVPAVADPPIGLGIDPLEGVVLKKDMTPWRTNRAALMAAKGRGQKGLVPVQLEGGGWGLRALPTAESTVALPEAVEAPGIPPTPAAPAGAPGVVPGVTPEEAIALPPDPTRGVAPGEAIPLGPPETGIPVAAQETALAAPDEAIPLPPPDIGQAFPGEEAIDVGPEEAAAATQTEEAETVSAPVAGLVGVGGDIETVRPELVADSAVAPDAALVGPRQGAPESSPGLASPVAPKPARRPQPKRARLAEPDEAQLVAAAQAIQPEVAETRGVSPATAKRPQPKKAREVPPETVATAAGVTPPVAPDVAPVAEVPRGWAVHRRSDGQWFSDSVNLRTKPKATRKEAVQDAIKEATTGQALTAAKEQAKSEGLTGREAFRRVSEIMEAREVPPEPAKPVAPVDVVEVKPREAAKLIKAAEQETNTEPTEAQAKAGNYKKGKVRIGGLDIAIENPKGSKRRGKGPDGTPWEVTMPAIYGDIKRTEGADGDSVDVYVGEKPDAPTVWVVDQKDADTGKFDEHKAFVGFESQDQVVETYDKAFDDGRGPERRDAVVEMPFDSFREWVRKGDTKKALATNLGDVAGAAVDRTAEVARAVPPEEATSVKPETAAPVAAEPVVKADGTPYKTKNAARFAGRSRKLPGHEPVQVDGGWALQPPDAPPVASQEARSAPAPVPAPAVAPEPAADVPPAPALEAEPAESPALNVIPESRAKSYTPDGETEIETEFAVIDAAELVASHDAGGRPDPRYPAEMQPRERERGTSQRQIRRISARIRPALLADSHLTDSGAPIVGPDAAVESGNGRAAAIKLAYNEGRADDYRSMVEEKAKAAGIDAKGMEAPVLVRVRRSGDTDRSAFARGSNVSTAGRMSASEQAKSDASTVGPEILEQYARSPDVAMTRFVRELPSTEEGALLDSQGRPSKELRDRVQNAVLWRAYGSDRILQAAAETVDPDAKTLLNALNTAAPAFANVEDGTAKQAIVDAVDKIAAARARGMNAKQITEQVLAQGEILEGDFDPPARAAAAAMMDRMRSAKQMSTFLQELGERSERHQERERMAGGGMDLLGDVAEAADALTLVRQADESTAVKETSASQSGLFAPPSPGELIQPRSTPIASAPAEFGLFKPKKKGGAEAREAAVSTEPAARAPRGGRPMFSRTAWHGSPHRFDKFSTKAIGTGEGAQAFGHGLYFAEEREVAEHYRNILNPREIHAPKTMKVAGKEFRQKDFDGEFWDSFSTFKGDKLNEPGELRGLLAEELEETSVSSPRYAKAQELAVALRSAKDSDIEEVSGPTLYKVDLAPKENEYLLWDEPLSKMPKDKQSALLETFGELGLTEDVLGSTTGEDFYTYVSDAKAAEHEGNFDIDPQREASMALAKTGIRGIKYRDAVSRAQPVAGDFNYVIFDESDVSITDIHLSRIGAQKPRAPGRPRTPIGAPGVQAAIDPITAKWESDDAPKVRVVDSAAELPENIRSSIDATPDQAAPDGAYDPDTGTIYLIGDQIRTADQAKRVLAHEAIGHHSFERIMGDELPKVFADVLKMGAQGDAKVGPIFEGVERDYAGAPDEVLAAETVARMAEEGVRNSIMTRVVAKVRRFLRGLGMRLSYSYAEVQDMLRRAARHLQTPSRPVPSTDVQRRQGKVMGELLTAASRPNGERILFSRQRSAPGAPAAKQTPQPIDRVYRALMGPLGGLNDKGEWVHVDKLRKGARKVIWEAKPMPEGRFGFLGPVINTARHGWLNRYGTPKEFIAREHAAQADEARILTEGIAFVEQINRMELSREDSESLQRILEGEELTDAKLKAVAEPIRVALDDYGRQLVEAGLLPKGAYMKNLGRWLHRSYRKYEADATPLQKWVRGRGKKRALKGDALMMRGKRHPVSWPKLLSGVPEGAKQAALKATAWEVLEKRGPDGGLSRRTYWPKGTPVPAEYQGPGWQSLGEWELLHVKTKGKPARILLRQDYTKAEREQMGEIRMAEFNILKSYQVLAHDLSRARMFNDIARNPNWFQDTVPTDGSVVVDATGNEAGRHAAMGFSGVDWVKVPGTEIPKSGVKRWGRLADGYLRAEMWRDLTELNKMQNPGFWGELMREYKMNKTARSPGVHFNNLMSNFFLMDLHDLTWTHFADAVREWRAGGDVYKEAQIQGIFNSTYVSQELQREQIGPILDKALREADADTGKTSMQRIIATLGKFDRKMRGAYQFEDEIFRLASFMRDVDQGMPVEAAAERGRDNFLNYDIRAPWPNYLRRTVLPFFSYSYAFIPKAVDAIAARPWKVAKWVTVAYALGVLAYELADGDEELERATMHPRDAGRTWLGIHKMQRLPFNSARGDAMYLNLSRVIPGGGMLETDKGPGKVFGAPVPEIFMLGGPLILAAEAYLNKQAFTQQPVFDKDIDTTAEIAQKQAAFVYRSLAPNAPWVPGSWSWKMLGQAMSEETDAFGNQYSVPTAIVRQFGPKVIPHDPVYRRSILNNEFKFMMNKRRQRMRQLARQRSRGKISQDSYQSQINRQLEAVRKAVRKHTEGT